MAVDWEDDEEYDDSEEGDGEAPSDSEAVDYGDEGDSGDGEPAPWDYTEPISDEEPIFYDQGSEGQGSGLSTDPSDIFNEIYGDLPSQPSIASPYYGPQTRRRERDSLSTDPNDIFADMFKDAGAPEEPSERREPVGDTREPTEHGYPTAWADGSPMSEEEKRLARVYALGRETGLDQEGSQALASVAKTEGGLFGATNTSDPGGSYGVFQLNAFGQLPNFATWLRQNGIDGDPKELAKDIDLATRFAATNYLGAAIKQGQQRGVHGAALATYAQQYGQVSINPWKAGQNYEAMFSGGDRYNEALAHATPSPSERQARANAVPFGHYVGDDHDHKQNPVATPYTELQADKAGNVWEVAFDFDAPYDHPFNPAIPRHRGVDLIIPDAEARGFGKNGMGAPYTAFRDGEVAAITQDPNGGIGIIVKTDDPDHPYDRYFHNNNVLVQQGQRVTAGETILGQVGQTGTEGFPHLHYEVSKNINGDPMGQTIDPRPFMSRPVRPVQQQTAQAPAQPRAPFSGGAPAQAMALPAATTTRAPFQGGFYYGPPGGGERQDPGFLRGEPGAGDRMDPGFRRGAPVDSSEAARKAQEAADAENRRVLGDHIFGALQEWQAMRRANGEDPNNTEDFRAHLRRIGAPDPWAPRTAPPAAPSAPQRPAAAPAAPAQGQRQVYQIGGREVTEAEYRQAEARNAEIDRQAAAIDRLNAANAERYAAAQQEADRLNRWNEQARAAQVDPEAASTLGPRPETPNLDFVQAQGAAIEDTYGAREQTREQKQALTSFIETYPYQGVDTQAREQTPAEKNQFIENYTIPRRLEEINAPLREAYGVTTPFELVRNPDGTRALRPTPELSAAIEDRANIAQNQYGAAVSAQIAEHPMERERALQDMREHGQGIKNTYFPGPTTEEASRGETTETEATPPTQDQTIWDQAWNGITTFLTPDLSRPGRIANEILDATGIRNIYRPGTVQPIETPKPVIDPSITVSESTNNAWQRGWNNARTSMLDDAAELARVHGWGDVADWFQADSNRIKQQLIDNPELNRRAANDPLASPQGMLEGLVENAPSMLPNVLALMTGVGGMAAEARGLRTAATILRGASSGIARAGLLAGSMQQAGQQLESLRPDVEAGRLDRGTANVLALGGGLVEYATEHVFPGLDRDLLDGIGHEATQRFEHNLIQRGLIRAGQLTVDIGREVGQEAAEEALSQAYQTAVEETFTNNHPGLSARIREIGTAAFMGGLAGGVLAGPVAVGEAVGERLNRPIAAAEVANITSPDGVSIHPISDDWTRYAVVLRDQQGRPTAAPILLGVDGNNVRIMNLDQMENVTIPQLETREQAGPALQNYGTVLRFLNRYGALPEEAVARAQDQFTKAAQTGQTVSRGQVGEGLRTSEAPQVAESGVSVTGLNANDEWHVGLPASWQPPVQIPNSPMQHRAREGVPQELTNELVNLPAQQQLSTAGSNMIHAMDERLRDSGVLPQGRVRPVGTMSYGGAVDALNLGRVARANGLAQDAGAISLDIGSHLYRTIREARAAGITDWENDERFVPFYATKFAGVIAHEVGHDISTLHAEDERRGGDPTHPHEAATATFALAVENERRALEPVIQQLWATGGLRDLYTNQLQTLAAASPNERWQAHARGVIASEQAAANARAMAGTGEESRGGPGSEAAEAVSGRGGELGAGPPVDLGPPTAGVSEQPGPTEHPALVAARQRTEQRGLARTRDEANAYVARYGIRSSVPQSAYVANDPAVQRRIANYYEMTPDSPDDPEVRRAYGQMAKEVKDQFDYVRSLGVRFIPYYDNRPAGDGSDFHGYASSGDMQRDVDQNRRLYVYADALDHPLLTGGPNPEDNANWQFRAVHDYFGHTTQGNQFGPLGEENAWLEHVKMFSPLAARAMTTETRGQNSWVNFGPQAEGVPLKERPFAEQKSMLLPGWALSRPDAYPGQIASMISQAVQAGGSPDGSASVPVGGTRQQAEYAAAVAAKQQDAPEVVVAHMSTTGDTATATMEMDDPRFASVLANGLRRRGFHVSQRAVQGGARSELFVVVRDTVPREALVQLARIEGALQRGNISVAVDVNMADAVTFTRGDYDAIIERGPGEGDAGSPESIGPPTRTGRVGTGTGAVGTNTSDTGSDAALRREPATEAARPDVGEPAASFFGPDIGPPSFYEEPPAIVREATPRPESPGPYTPPEAIAPRTAGTAVIDAQTGLIQHRDAVGPPLITPEDAVAQGWVGLPPLDPTSPIQTHNELLHRLREVSFISQRDLINFLGERPEDLDQVVEFMVEQRQKLAEGKMLPSDVAKAYYMTASTQGQGAINAEIIRDKTGLAIPDHFLRVNDAGVRQIRPEDAAAAWLASPMGQRALHAIDNGVFDEEAWANGASIRAAFSDDRLNNLNVMGTRPSKGLTMRDIGLITRQINAAGRSGNMDRIDAIAQQLNGIGPRKIGYIQHLLGVGDTPTMDARAINVWLTGQGDIRGLDSINAQIARAMNNHLGSTEAGAVVLATIMNGYRSLQQSGFAPDIPQSVYSAVLHGWLWSKVKDIPTMMAPVHEAMRGARTAGRLATPVARAATRGIPGPRIRGMRYINMEPEWEYLEKLGIPRPRFEGEDPNAVAFNYNQDVLRRQMQETGSGRIDREGGPSAMVSMPVARQQPGRIRMPTDPVFAQAVANTPGAQITPDGLLSIDLVRYQSASQIGEPSVRTGVFYLPASVAKNLYRGMSPAGYGGNMEIRGNSNFRRPMFVRGATGGVAVQRAYDMIQGKGAYDELRQDFFQSLPSVFQRGLPESARRDAVEMTLMRHGGNPALTDEIMNNHDRSNRMVTAVTEHVAAQTLRDAGYDSLVGYSTTRRGPVISEIFDLRESTYPDELGFTELHPEFRPTGGPAASSYTPDADGDLVYRAPVTRTGGYSVQGGELAYVAPTVVSDRPTDSNVRAQQLRSGEPGGYTLQDGELAYRPPTGEMWATPEQEITSARTSIKQVPALMRRVPWQQGSINFDLGGGAYDDTTQALAAQGVENLVYDPYNRSEGHNQQVLDRVRAEGGADTVTIANVLNVIREPESRRQVLERAASVLAPGGRVYISAYSGDRSGQGQQTRSGWQENRGIRTYLDEVRQVFPDAVVRGAHIEASAPVDRTGPAASVSHPGDIDPSLLTGAGLEPFDPRRGGLAVPDPGYPPGTPEANVEDAFRRASLAQGTSTPSLSAAEMGALTPQMPDPNAPVGRQAVDRHGNPKVNRNGDPVIEQSWYGHPASADDLRLAIEVGLPHRRWYTNFGTWAKENFGEANAHEFRVLFGITSSRTPVDKNLINSINAMYIARVLDQRGQLFDPDAWEQMRQSLRYTAWDGKTNSVKLERDGTPQQNKIAWTGQMTGKMVAGYETGTVLNSANAKTASYSGNVLSGALMVYDPNSTIDTWMGQLIGWQTDRFANDDAAYRTAHAIFNRLAREQGLNPHEAQAAGWFTIKTLTERAPDIRARMNRGEISLGEGIREAQERDIFHDVRGDLDDVIRQPGVQEGLARLATVLDKDNPGPGHAGDMQMIYPGEETRRPYAIRPISNETVEAGRALAEAQAPTLSVPVSEERAGVEGGRLPWLTVPHKIFPNATGFTLTLPGGNYYTARWAAAELGRRANLDSLTVHQANSQAPNVGGVKFFDRDGLHDEMRLSVTDALDQANIPYIIGPNGDYVAVVADTSMSPDQIRNAVQLVQNIGWDSLEAVGYAADITTIGAADYAGISEELGPRYGPGGRPDLQQPALDTGEPGEGPAASYSAPGDERAPGVALGRESGRAAMTRLNTGEDEIIAHNRQIIAEGYAGDMAPIVTKEVVQNSVDASRDIPGAHTEVDIEPATRTITVIDQGTGMTKDIVNNEFTKYRGSFKASDFASGGKGTAKAAILGQSSKIELRTVARIGGTQLPDLVQRADAINLNDTNGMLTVQDRDGRTAFAQIIPQEEIASVIGTHLAERLLAADPSYGYRVLAGHRLQTAKEDAEAEGAQFQETIAWGDSEDYLRPSRGLAWESGPLGWVDEAIRNGTLPQGSLTRSDLRAPWSDYITGTRLATSLLPSAEWVDPTLDPYRPSAVENWMNDFVQTNKLDSQTVRFTIDGAPFKPQAISDYQRADTFLKTIPGPTWDIDLYASDAMAERQALPIKAMNNGLFQLVYTERLPRPVNLPYMIVANIRSKVGAKEHGYPWSGDRLRLIAGTQEAISDYVQNEMFREIANREASALDRALETAEKVAGGDGRMVNVGSVEGSVLDSLHDLAERPYMAILNKGMTALHNHLENILQNKTWNSVYGVGTFRPSAFGGFGVSTEWIGLNVSLGWSGRSQTVKSRYAGKEYLLLYDPWSIVEQTLFKASEMGVPIRGDAQGQPQAPKKMKPPRLPKSLLKWDPEADVETPVVDTYFGGPVEPNNLDWELGRAEANARSYEQQSDTQAADYYWNKAESIRKARDAYLKKLQSYLAAWAVHSGDSNVLMYAPEKITPVPKDPNGYYYSGMYHTNAGGIVLELAQAQQNAEKGPDPDYSDPGYWQKEVQRLQAQYDYNAATEDMFLSHILDRDGIASMLVGDLWSFDLDQSGLDSVARLRAQKLDNFMKLGADDTYSKEQAVNEIAAIDEAIERAEKITGLRAEMPGQVRFNEGTQALLQADKPLTQAYKELVRGWFLGTTQHEFIHNAVREHGREEFSNFLTFLVSSTNDSETHGIVDRMIAELERSGGFEQMASDMTTYRKIRSAENVFAKVGVRADVGTIDRESNRGDVYGGREGTGRAAAGRLSGDGADYGVQSEQDLQPRGERQSLTPEELRSLPGWIGDESEGAGGPSATASHPVDDGNPMLTYSTPDGQIPMFGDDEVAMAPAPGDDPFQDVDPDYLQAIDDYEASREMDFPDDPPMTDTPADIPDAIADSSPESLSPERPEGDDVVNAEKFPAWAQKLIQLGELTSTRTDVNTREPMVEGQPDVLETPAVDMNDARTADIQNLITKGPNAKLLTSAEIDALRGAILLQYDRYMRAATNLQQRQGGDVDLAALRALDEAMRYAAITGLATTPMDSWSVLESTLAKAPLSQGQGDTLDQFLAANRDLIGNPNDLQRGRLRQLAMERADSLVGPDTGPRPSRGTRGRSARVVEGARALADTATTPGIPPSVQAGVIRSNEDLGIGIVEAALAARYNGLLLGPRGILVDYITNTGQLMSKVLTDPFLPSQGGRSVSARVAITRAEMAAVRKFWPIMQARASSTLLYGVSEQQSEATGTPRSISGRLTVRLENAHADYMAAKAQARAARDRGDTVEAAKQEKLAADANATIWALRGKKTAAIGFVEVAGRLKSVADVSIGTLAYGMELARNAGIMAYQEGKYPVGSDLWYLRVAEIMDGRNLDPDSKQNAIKYAELQRSATREAQRMTYQGQMGTIGRAMEKIQRNQLGSFVLPFLRALYHIRGMAIDYSPLGAVGTAYDVARSYIPTDNRFMRATRNMGGIAGGPYQYAFNNRNGVVGPGVADLDRRMAANAIGTAAFFWILGQAFAGNISGSGPPDDPIPLLEDDDVDMDAQDLRKTLESTGWRRYSVRIPWGGKNHWVSYANWGPLAYLLSAAAAIAEAYKYGMPKDVQRPAGDDIFNSQKLYQMATQGDGRTAQTAARRFASVAKEMSYLSGFFDLYGFITNAGALVLGQANPDPKLTDSQRTYEQRRQQAEASRYLGNLITQFMPLTSLVNTIAQSQDPMARAPEFGDLRSQLAMRTPNLWFDIGPPVGLPDAYADRRIPVIGSQTGRRQGLAEQTDRLGRDVENEYYGISAFSPFHVVDENLSSPVLNAAIEAGVGIPGAPTEVSYKPEGMEKQRILITPRMREALGEKIGQDINKSVTDLMKQWPEEKRRADPDGWASALKDTMKETRSNSIKQYVDSDHSLLPMLAQDPNRRRKAEPPPDKLNPPDIGPPTGGTPTATPRPGASPGPTTTPRRGGTPAPTATPAPAATPNPANETPAERNRRLIRERMQTPVPAGR